MVGLLAATMTHREASRLVKGQKVLAHISGKWVEAIVVNPYQHDETTGIVHDAVVRREGLNRNSGPYKIAKKRPRELRHLRPDVQPIPANIYADFLDEHGEPSAAQKLREAFPMPASDK